LRDFTPAVGQPVGSSAWRPLDPRLMGRGSSHSAFQEFESSETGQSGAFQRPPGRTARVGQKWPQPEAAQLFSITGTGVAVALATKPPGGTSWN
jgi:hypothetical protein